MHGPKFPCMFFISFITAAIGGRDVSFHGYASGKFATSFKNVISLILSSERNHDRGFFPGPSGNPSLVTLIIWNSEASSTSIFRKKSSKKLGVKLPS